MKLLSIETSCDDTAISIMEAKGGITNASFKVLANNSNSQINIHIPYGGVYPVLAKREHAKNLPIILEASLKQARLKSPQGRTLGIQKGSTFSRFENPGIDAIAVTYGPGLEMCLWEGIAFAKNLAKKWKVPLIPVNHMEGHVLSVFGKGKGRFFVKKVKTPIISLLVSGGHTQLVLTKKWMDYEIIGKTLDDAVGEAFDKVSRMLDLPYPGGPQISKLAEQERQRKRSFAGTPQADGLRTEQIFQQENRDPAKLAFSFALPRPMLHSKNFNFSFSGLKTAVLYLIRDLTKKHSNILPARNASHNEAGGQNDKIKKAIALEFENAAIECLVYKTQKAMEKYKIRTLIVAGGVACNTHLQREMKKIVRQDLTAKKVKLLFPKAGLAGDNSLMIGIAGYLNYMKNKKKVPKPDKIKATGNLRL